MPNSYTQYNTNAAALMDAHTAVYTAWYEAAVVLYLIAAVVFAAYWFTRSWTPLGAGIVFASLGIIAQTLSLGLRWHYSGHVPWNDLFGSLSVVALLSKWQLDASRPVLKTICSASPRLRTRWSRTGA